MATGKPIIGIAGGIGSGKSYVARLFGELGCLVISSDEQVREIYENPDVKATLVEWWGPQMLRDDGSINRRAIAERVFSNSADRNRLEALIHPRVFALRDKVMSDNASNAGVRAFVWDTPLLFETGTNHDCDAVVFVDAPPAVRARRITRDRGWAESELPLREKSQLPLDSKREMSDYVISNAADAGEASTRDHGMDPAADALRSQVQDVLSRILQQFTSGLRFESERVSKSLENRQS